MATTVLEAPKKLLRFRVLSKDQVYYCMYDLDEDKYLGAFYDERCTSPAGLWAWQEQEVMKAVKQYVEIEKIGTPA